MYRDSLYLWLKVSFGKWIEYVKIVFLVDLRIVILLVLRFLVNIVLKFEVI